MAGPAPKTYSAVQKALHWVVFLIFVGHIVTHETMVDAWKSFVRDNNVAALDSPVVMYHVWGGIAVLIFALWRLVLRKTRGAPEVPAEEPAPLKFVASATHILLYVIMIAMPMSGAMAYFGGVREAGEVHELIKPVMIAMILLHVAGALYQHFFLKTDVLKRMTHG